MLRLDLCWATSIAGLCLSRWRVDQLIVSSTATQPVKNLLIGRGRSLNKGLLVDFQVLVAFENGRNLGTKVR